METKPNEIKKEEQKTVSSGTIKVTSSKTIDFLSLDWAIRAGEIRELPADEGACAIILSNHFISKVKN